MHCEGRRVNIIVSIAFMQTVHYLIDWILFLQNNTLNWDQRRWLFEKVFAIWCMHCEFCVEGYIEEQHLIISLKSFNNLFDSLWTAIQRCRTRLYAVIQICLHNERGQ